MSKKLQAFTILELAVVMLISGIIISITYNSLEIFHRLNQQFKQNNEAHAQILLLDRLLFQDFDQSESIEKSGAGVLCKKGVNQINYLWYSNGVIRRTGLSSDTFFVKNEGIISYLQANLQEEEGGMVDKITFEGVLGDTTRHFSYAHTYAPDVFLNATP